MLNWVMFIELNLTDPFHSVASDAEQIVRRSNGIGIYKVSEIFSAESISRSDLEKTLWEVTFKNGSHVLTFDDVGQMLSDLGWLQKATL